MPITQTLVPIIIFDESSILFLSVFGYSEHCNQHELFKLAQTNRISQTTIAKSHVYRIVIPMSSPFRRRRSRRRDEIRRRRSATYCRRLVHHHPHPIGRVEIYREPRILSIRQIVAGKFRPKKKRRGQGNKKLCKSFQFVGGGRIKLWPSYKKPCSLSSRPLSPSYNLTTFDLVSLTI